MQKQHSQTHRQLTGAWQKRIRKRKCLKDKSNLYRDIKTLKIVKTLKTIKYFNTLEKPLTLGQLNLSHQVWFFSVSNWNLSTLCITTVQIRLSACLLQQHLTFMFHVAWEHHVDIGRKAMRNLIRAVKLKRISRNMIWKGFQTTFECRLKWIHNNFLFTLAKCVWIQIRFGLVVWTRL